jgi:membrane-associated phospholipid phosphatase
MSVFETLRVSGWRSGAGNPPPSGHAGWQALLARRALGALIAVSATCALLLPAEIMVGDAVRDLDRDVAIDAHRFTASERVLHLSSQVVTFFGSTVWLTLMVALTAAGWVRQRRTAAAALLLVSAIGSALVCRTIKLVIGRDRPSLVPELADPYGSSFPSGHAMQSVAIYGVLLLIVAPRLAPRARCAVVASVAAFVAAIAISRVMLGVHYASDITVGVVLGVVWLAAVALLDPSLLEAVRGSASRQGKAAGRRSA